MARIESNHPSHAFSPLHRPPCWFPSLARSLASPSPVVKFLFLAHPYFSITATHGGRRSSPFSLLHSPHACARKPESPWTIRFSSTASIADALSAAYNSTRDTGTRKIEPCQEIRLSEFDRVQIEHGRVVVVVVNGRSGFSANRPRESSKIYKKRNFPTIDKRLT